MQGRSELTKHSQISIAFGRPSLLDIGDKLRDVSFPSSFIIVP
jgi:hypothetical protein